MKIFIPILTLLFLFFQVNLEEENHQQKTSLNAIIQLDTPKIAENSFYSLDNIEKTAQFKGEKDFLSFIKNNLKYPSSAARQNIEGVVLVNFVIDEKGRMMKDCVKVNNPINSALETEAIRIIKSSPNWSIPMYKSKAIKQRFQCKIIFELSSIGVISCCTEGVDTTHIFDKPHKSAIFEGGEVKYQDFLTKNLKVFPVGSPTSQYIKTKVVFVSFILDTKGFVMKDSVKIIKSATKEIDEEAIRVIKLMPNWIPAKHCGVQVRQRQKRGIVFAF